MSRRPAQVAKKNGKPERELGRRLLAWRIEKGLNRSQAAEEIGVSRDTIYNWEVRGKEPLQYLLRRHLIKLGFLPEDAIEPPVRPGRKPRKRQTAGSNPGRSKGGA